MKLFITLMSLILIFTTGCKSTANVNDNENNNALPNNISEKNFKKVSILTPDGMILSGNLYKSAIKGDKPYIIMFHMLGSRKESYQPLIESLIKKNYSILSVDFRGHGESSAISDERPKKYTEFNNSDWQGLITDVKSSIDFLKETKELNKNGIILVGASIGANASLIAASKNDNTDNIKGIVALSSGLNYHNLIIEDFIKKSNIKTLIISSQQDAYAFTTYKQLESLHKHNLEFISYPGNSHGTNLFSEHPNSLEDISNWISKIK